MKKLLIVFLSLCILTGCGDKKYKNSKSATSDLAKDTTISVNSTSNTDSTSNSTSSTTSENLVTNTIAVESTTTKKSTTKKITTTKKVTQIAATKTTKSTTLTTTKLTLNEKDIKSKIMELQKLYPTGTSWTNENRRYGFKASNRTNYTGRGCAAFAFMASDYAFGTLPVKELRSFNNIRVGDIIRYMNDTHSVIVTDVYSDYVIVAEANITLEGYESGIVYWGRKVYKKDIKATGTYIYTRWP